jgi:signal peptide peptidase SppA
MTVKFKDKLDNTPHLMTEQSFVTFVSFEETLPSRAELSNLFDDSRETPLINYNQETQVGTLFLHGALEYRTEWYHKYGYGMSYELLLEQAQTFLDAGAKTLLLEVDSGGGEAYGMMEAGTSLRKMADEAGVKVVAYVDGISASAAYGLTSQAHEVISNPQAEVGSVGVVVRLRNISAAMKKAGVEDTYIYAGKNKIPYKADGSFSKEFTDGIQTKVDALYEEFTNYVAENRGMSVEAVKSTEAGVYSAKDALELGLIDSVMTHEEFYTYLADYVQKEKKPQMFKLKTKLSSEQEKVEMKELEDAQAELSALKVKMEADTLANATAVAELATLNATLTDVQAQLEVFKTAAAALEAEKQAAVEAAATTKLEARKTELSAVLPEDQVEAAMTALADASDAVFTFAVAGYKAKAEAQVENPLFKEQGTQGAEVDHGKPDAKAAYLEWQNKKYSKATPSK